MTGRALPPLTVATAAALALTVVAGCGGSAPRADASRVSASATARTTPGSPTPPSPAPGTRAAPGEPQSAPTLAPDPAASPAVSSTTPAPRRWPRTAPRPAGVDRRDVDAVARAFLVLAYTVDTRVDTSPGAGSVRAAALAGGVLAGRLRAAPQTRGDAAWTRLQTSTGYRSVAVVRSHDDGGPTASSPDTTYAAYVLTLTDHPGGVYAELAAFLQLDRSGDGTWAVVSMKVS